MGSVVSLVQCTHLVRMKSLIRAKFYFQMYLDGFVNIVNIDISSVCIEKMEQLHQNTPMTWKVADVTDLSLFEVRVAQIKCPVFA